MEMEPASTTPTSTPTTTAPLTARDVDADVLPLVYEIIRRYNRCENRHVFIFEMSLTFVFWFQCRAGLARQR